MMDGSTGRQDDEGSEELIGMMFTYEDDLQQSVGEFLQR